MLHVQAYALEFVHCLLAQVGRVVKPAHSLMFDYLFLLLKKSVIASIILVLALCLELLCETPEIFCFLVLKDQKHLVTEFNVVLQIKGPVEVGWHMNGLLTRLLVLFIAILFTLSTIFLAKFSFL